MKILVAWLLLVSNAVAANFSGTDKEIVTEAERQFQRCAIFWTGQEYNLVSPCPISFTDKDVTEGGGVTNYSGHSGKITNYSIKVYGNRQFVLDNVVPHEVDHLFRGAITVNQIDNWIGEGSSQLFETDEYRLKIKARVKGYINSDQDEFSCWNYFGMYSYPDKSKIRNFYDTSFTVTEYLLLNCGKDNVLAFQKDSSKHSDAKWEKHFGETQKESYNRWTCQYAENPTIILVASDPARCEPCRRFEADKQRGLFSGLQFKYVTPVEISKGATKFIDSSGKELQNAAGSIPAFRIEGKDTVRVGYPETGGSQSLWATVKGILRAPLSTVEAAEELTGRKTPTPTADAIKIAQGQLDKATLPSPKESEAGPSIYERDRTKALESKVVSLELSIEKLLTSIKDARSSEGDDKSDAIKQAVRDAFDTLKQGKEVVNDAKEIKNNPQEGEEPFWWIVLVSIIGVIKRRLSGDATVAMMEDK